VQYDGVSKSFNCHVEIIQLCRRNFVSVITVPHEHDAVTFSVKSNKLKSHFYSRSNKPLLQYSNAT